MEKLDIQIDLQYADVVSSVKEIDGQSIMNIDAESFFDGDDIILNVAIWSKIDGQYNPIIKPAPINMCSIRDHEEPLVQFLHREIEKYGNITNACPPKIGLYYLHGFSIQQNDFPIPLPNGEFRLDVNSSFMDDGIEKKIASSELYFKTT
ncbi:unnamed protein product [Diamesa serratosioi]